MTRNRVGQILAATIVAVLAAGCSAAQSTGALGGSAANAMVSSPAGVAATPSATPELSPSPIARQSPSPSVAEWTDRAKAVIRALGGSTPADAAASVSPSGPADRPGTRVEIGDWTVEWDAAGRLASVTVVPSHPAPDQGVSISESQARLKAAGYLSDLGVTLAAPDVFTQDPELAWLARWERKIDGVPAPTDGTRMTMSPGGLFLSYQFSETPTATAPAKTISQAQALAKFPTCKNGTGGANGKVETCHAGLEWHSPMQTLGAPLQLCWRIDYTWHDNGGNNGASALWVDAGTGATVEFTTTT